MPCRLSGLTNRDGDRHHNQQSKAVGGRFPGSDLGRLHFCSIVAKFLAAELISIAGNDSGDIFSPFSAMGGLVVPLRAFPKARVIGSALDVAILCASAVSSFDCSVSVSNCFLVCDDQKSGRGALRAFRGRPSRFYPRSSCSRSLVFSPDISVDPNRRLPMSRTDCAKEMRLRGEGREGGGRGGAKLASFAAGRLVRGSRIQQALYGTHDENERSQRKGDSVPTVKRHPVAQILISSPAPPLLDRLARWPR